MAQIILRGFEGYDLLMKGGSDWFIVRKNEIFILVGVR